MLACEHPNHDDPAKLQNKDQRRNKQLKQTKWWKGILNTSVK
jgi:hypothetical protein